MSLIILNDGSILVSAETAKRVANELLSMPPIDSRATEVVDEQGQRRVISYDSISRVVL